MFLVMCASGFIHFLSFFIHVGCYAESLMKETPSVIKTRRLLIISGVVFYGSLILLTATPLHTYGWYK